MLYSRLIAWTLTGAAALVATPAVAANDCQLTAALGPGAQAVYDPFATADTVLNVTVTAQNRGDTPCQARFYVAPLGGELHLISGANLLSYRIDVPRGGGAGLPQERGPFILRVPGNASSTLEIPLIVPALQVVPKGDYDGEVEVRGVGESNEPISITGSSAPLHIVVPARAEMSISGTAAPPFSSHSMAPASIDFGEAVTGATQRVFVNVWSNGSVAITLSSENQGVLRHETNPSLTPIGYTATFDGLPVNLGAPFSVRRTPPLSLAGASYPFAVTLGNVAGHFAGRYKDVVTVNVDQN